MVLFPGWSSTFFFLFESKYPAFFNVVCRRRCCAVPQYLSLFLCSTFTTWLKETSRLLPDGMNRTNPDFTACLSLLRDRSTFRHLYCACSASESRLSTPPRLPRRRRHVPRTGCRPQSRAVQADRLDSPTGSARRMLDSARGGLFSFRSKECAG